MSTRKWKRGRNLRPLTLIPWPVTMRFQSASLLTPSYLPSTSHLLPHHHTSSPHQHTPLTHHQRTLLIPHPFRFPLPYPHPQTSIQPLTLSLSPVKWSPRLLLHLSRGRQPSLTTPYLCQPAPHQLALCGCCLGKKKGHLTVAETQLSQWPATVSPTASPPPAAHWGRA